MHHDHNALVNGYSSEQLTLAGAGARGIIVECIFFMRLFLDGIENLNVKFKSVGDDWCIVHSHFDRVA